MDLQLTGRRALVRGGTRAIVEALADEGAHVAFTSGTNVVVDGALTRGVQL